MVFESLVADLLNKYLGEYVENLDRSQLKIGIWGGDVVLNNLTLKQSALDELDLPVKTVYGYLGKLVLKIPWKNLYNAPVEAHIDKLYLLVVPNLNIVYNEEKEEKWMQEAKQAELKKIELAKKAELEKDKPKGDNTFAEKLAAQIIRNVQVSIKNIHIRYEDTISRPDRPFACGVTLHSLSVLTIKSWGDPTPIDPINLIFKELQLQCLCVYWNTSADLFFKKNKTPDEMKSIFEYGIATKDNSPENFKYMLGPINSSANLRINSKPETDGTNFSVPKILLNFDMETLLVRVARSQFQDILSLLDSMENMKTQILYRKYRPQASCYRGHYKEWWQFAYKCILETEVRRRRKNWDWGHIYYHRDLCKKYAQVYKLKLSTNKPSTEVIKNCQNFEKKLDILNILLIREKIEMEVKRANVAEMAKAAESSGGWLSRWWGGSSPSAKPGSPQDSIDLVQQFQEAMTTEEREKLFRAIDYQEGLSPTEFPRHFVMLDLSVQLHCLQLDFLSDSTLDPNILSVTFSDVSSRVQQRPSSSNVSVDVAVRDVLTVGCKQNGIIPFIIRPKSSKTLATVPSSVFTCSVELNPLDASCDQRVHVHAKPLNIVYDAKTVSQLVSLFAIEGKSAIQPLQAAASMKLAQLREKSAFGLQYVIDKHSIMDLQVDMMASNIILPKNGFYVEQEVPIIVLNLGRFEFYSKPRKKDDDHVNIKALHSLGKSEDEILAEMMSRSYDNFQLKLSDLQVLFAMPGENWDSEMNEISDRVYILKPTSLAISMAVSIIQDDPRLPKMKLTGQLPNIEFNLIEPRMMEIITLLLSIPLPESSSEPESPNIEMKGAAAMGSTFSLTGGIPFKVSPSQTSKPEEIDENFVQFTDLEIEFELKNFLVIVFQEDSSAKLLPLLNFRLMSLESSLVKKTFDLTIGLRLGGISLQQSYFNSLVQIINTPMASGQNDYLFSVTYTNVDRNSPEFHSRHGSTLQCIVVNFSKLDILFHQEAILYLMNMGNEISKKISNIQGEKLLEAKKVDSAMPINTSSAAYVRMLSKITEEGGLITQTKPTEEKKSRSTRRVEVIELKLDVEMNSLSVSLTTAINGTIAELGVTGGSALVTLKHSYTQVEVKLVGVYLRDPLSISTRYYQVLSVIDEKEALTANVVLFNDEERTARKLDMSVKASMACVRVIFINKYIACIMDFLNNFQAAQGAIVEASQAAAERAKMNVHTAYENAVRISLDIKIKAPLVIVPPTHQSKDAFLLDMGFLKIINDIVDVNTSSEETAALDHIQLELQNFKLSRVKLSPDLKVEWERLILKPISFQLSVQRNLSSAWFTGLPDLEIGGKLHTIHIVLFSGDYDLVMRVLNENLGNKTQGKPPMVAKPSVTNKLTDQKLDVTPKESHSEVRKGVDYLENVQTSVKFYFTLESLIVDVCTGDPTVNESSVEGLAELKLLVISMRGAMLSDSSLQLSLLLVDCMIDDLRPSQATKIKRYMERKVQGDETETTEVKSMVDLTYQQNASGATFVDLRIRSFNLILNVEHLMKILDVFSPPEPPEMKMLHPAQGTVPLKKVPTKLNTSLVEDTQDSKMMLTLNLKVEHPDIILVESMNDLDTSALILQGEIIFKMRMIKDDRFMHGSVSDIQLFSCCFNPLKRNLTKVHVLRPVNILVNCSCPQKEGQHVDICSTDVRLSISADVIQLLSSVYSTISGGVGVVTSESFHEMDNSSMWAVSTFEDSDFLFLSTEVADEAYEELPRTAQPRKPIAAHVSDFSEICTLAIPKLIVTVESGTGQSRIPMLLLESKLEGIVKDWSTELNMDTQLTLQVSYYNSSLALWEPLVEPVEEVKNYQFSFTPWFLNVQVEMHKPEEDVSISRVKPQMSIFISSKEIMSITLTRSCLEVLTTLSASFTDAIFKPAEKGILDQGQYILINDTGIPVDVSLETGDFKLFSDQNLSSYSIDKEGEEIKIIKLDSGAQVGLNPLDKDTVTILDTSTQQDRFINVKVVDYDCEIELPVMKADKRFFMFTQRTVSNEPLGIVSDVKVKNGCTYITLRSIIQIINHFSVPINVYYMTSKGNEVRLVGTVEPHHTLNLPLEAVYTPTSELFFSVLKYSVSIEPFKWKDLQNALEKTILLQCNPKNVEDKEPFFINVTGELEQVYFELTNRHTMTSNCYNLTLRPAVVMKNLLPVEVVCCLQGMICDLRVPSGQQLQMHTAQPGASSLVIRIPDYLDKEWSCKTEIPAHPNEFGVYTFSSYEGMGGFLLHLGIHAQGKHGSYLLSLYCPFWMINNTGRMLSYRSDETSHVIFHPEDFHSPIMFSFVPKSFFAKKKSSIRVNDGPWSDKFSLDVAGSSGVVSCKHKDMTYQIGVNIRLTNNTLTKQIIFTPFFVFLNNCSVPVELKEEGPPNASWIEVEPQQCSPFWPTQSKSSLLVLRASGSKETSIPFHYDKVHNSLLRLKNKYGAVSVDVNISEGRVLISLFPYEIGMAPALIVNHTGQTIDIQEKGCSQSVVLLRPMEKVLFTWNTSDDFRALLCSNGKLSHNLRQDGIGEFEIDKGTSAFWVSFLYGLQRVFLLTENDVIAQQAQSISDFDAISQEIDISIHGIGLSLVDNISQVEVLYVGITSSGIIWESKRESKNRFKPFSHSDSNHIEEAYNRYCALEAAGGQTMPVSIDNRILVDFSRNLMLKPSYKTIARRYNTGMWLNMKSSSRQLQIHAKINRIQIDNQMSDCVFPVVFSPIPPPKSVVAGNVSKPFVEVSIVKRLNSFSAVQQYKYFKLLVQEFHVKVDLGFITALVKLFETAEATEEELNALFEKDLQISAQPLLGNVSFATSQDQKNFYDMLHLSPLKIHVSFSLSGGQASADDQKPEFLSVFTQSFGVTLTDMQDVVFKLGYFERQYVFMTQNQLQSEVQSHYVSQLLKQLYVLVLGLDVIGNPLGLFVGFTQGAADLFYEPFQGAIQGPGEFAEGLMLGMKSLFGHTVGGAAGAFSKITGAMGKGLAALTFDKDFQRQRREAMTSRPANVQEGLAQSGRGLVMGVVEGVGGVITKPIAGAKEEGIQGFFKGVGKGVVGLVTRPTTGVIDFASGSFSAVKRATDNSVEVLRLRAPRHFDSDFIVRPYSSLQAEGTKLLNDLEKGKYVPTDSYVFHMPIGQGRQKDMLLLTDNRIAYLSHNELFGGYQLEWAHTWGEMPVPPREVDNGVALTVSEKKKGVKLFSSSSPGKILLIKELVIRKFLVSRITEFMERGSGSLRSNSGSSSMKTKSSMFRSK